MSAVKPHKLYLGEKDFQQCLVIKRLLTLTDNPAEMVICPIRREANGLAMSSRNELLSKGAREKASAIFYCLKSKFLKSLFGESLIKYPKLRYSCQLCFKFVHSLAHSLIHH
jgi:pantoate--beta-alanine ligase